MLFELYQIGPKEKVKRLTSLRENFGPDGFITTIKAPDGSTCLSSSDQIHYYKLKDLFDALAGSGKHSVQRWIDGKLIELAKEIENINKAEHDTQLDKSIFAALCSDGHLGTKNSREDEFYRWLSKQKAQNHPDGRHPRYVDLFNNTMTDARLVERASAEHSIELWKALAKARGTGLLNRLYSWQPRWVCILHRIQPDGTILPDPVVGFQSFPKRPFSNDIRTATMKYRLVDVADIHYPFLKLDEFPKRILLTHGHFANFILAPYERSRRRNRNPGMAIFE